MRLFIEHQCSTVAMIRHNMTQAFVISPNVTLKMLNELHGKFAKFTINR